MFQHIYKGIEAAIGEIAEIKHFDWYNNQDREDKENLPFARPAVFVQFFPASTKTLGNAQRQVQQANIRFTLILVTDNKYEARTGSSTQNKALEHLNLVDAVYKKMQRRQYMITVNDVDYQVFNSCSRTSINTDHNKKHMIRTEQEFRTLAFDYAAERSFVVPDPMPKLTIIPQPQP